MKNKPPPQNKNHSDWGFGKKYSLSYKKPHPVNTDTLFNLKVFNRVYQIFLLLHFDTL